MTGDYIGALPDPEWQGVLDHCMSVADRFRVHVPDGDGPLSNGRAAFQALLDTSLQPWSGMHDAIEISGPLTAEAKSLFRDAEPSLELMDPTRKLWDYELLVGDEVLLSIGDFTDLVISEEGLRVLAERGLLTSAGNCASDV